MPLSAHPQLVRIASAYTPTQVIQLRMLLNRISAPYVVRNEAQQNLLGAGSMGFFNTAIGCVEFWVPSVLQAEVERQLAALFEVEQQLPTHCPACGAATQPPAMDCPACGLFLG